MEGNNEIFESRIDFTQLEASINSLKEEIRQIIVGQDQMIEMLIAAVLSNGHVLLEGAPGVAKTLSAKVLSQTVDAGFSRIQFTPDLMPSDVLGTSIYSQKSSDFEFKKGPIFSNFILIDEINRAPAKTQAAMFEVMEERQVTIDGITYPMSDPFIVLATQNPIEHEGTYSLPEAQLDRFLFKIVIDYPALEDEIEVLQKHHDRKGVNDVSAVRKILSPEKIAEYRKLVQTVRVEPQILNYIVQIVQTTRKHPDLFLGGSPRASLAILDASKAIAAMRNRDFVSPDDVKYVVIPTLRHRVMMTPEREMEGLKIESVLSNIVEEVEIPR